MDYVKKLDFKENLKTAAMTNERKNTYISVYVFHIYIYIFIYNL